MGHAHKKEKITEDLNNYQNFSSPILDEEDYCVSFMIDQIFVKYYFGNKYQAKAIYDFLLVSLPANKSFLIQIKDMTRLEQLKAYMNEMKIDYKLLN